MGLSIHFSGRLRKAEDLPALIEEIKDVSNVYGWKYHLFDTRFPNDTFENQTSFENVYGINFTPTNCETISLTFLSNGAMVAPERIEFFLNTEHEPYIYQNRNNNLRKLCFFYTFRRLFFKYCVYFIEYQINKSSKIISFCALPKY